MTPAPATTLRALPVAVLAPVPACLAGATVLTQISYPLLGGAALTAATMLTVLLFCAASLSHAWQAFGARTALTVLGTAGGLGLAAEALGVATGYPFGGYRYAPTLGPMLLGVPLLVPLAWTMMAYPCLLLARRLTRPLAGPAGLAAGARPAVLAVTGGTALAAWDLFLDPQMVDAGHWVWDSPDPHLPGVPGIPLTNALGWLLVGTLMTAALHRQVPEVSASAATAEPSAELVPAVLLGWTWFGSTLANLAFFHRPWVALYGGLALGALVLPYLRALRDQKAVPRVEDKTEAGVEDQERAA